VSFFVFSNYNGTKAKFSFASQQIFAKFGKNYILANKSQIFSFPEKILALHHQKKSKLCDPTDHVKVKVHIV
jgi:hypothetical protein